MKVKYKVWHIGREKFIQDETMVYIDESGNVFEIDEGQYGHMFKNCITDSVKVVMFTGSKDKNGVEIFEGNIVRYLDAYMNGADGEWDECSCVGEIKWDHDLAQFYVTNRESMDNDDFWEQVEEFEVVGNIYENSDLLTTIKEN